VIYEDLVEDTEGEVRRLLDHLRPARSSRLPAVLRNDRAVRTVSSEQVRRPIYRDAIEHWHHFEPYLVPLRQALGSALTDYPYT
jgi:hypothetical protein